MKYIRFFLFFVFLLVPFIAVSQAQESAKTAYVLEVKGPIGPATTDYIKRQLAAAVAAKAEVVVLEMHTPGGLVTSMQEIISAILASPVPVVTYVSPPGSHAASAGTYILYASHIAAMAPGTNLGAATPIEMDGSGGLGDKVKEEGGSSKEALKAKMINDAAAYIRGLADMRGRNREWAEAAVREAQSLSAEEALEQKVIDVMAGSVAELLEKIDGREVTVNDKPHSLQTKGARVVTIKPDLRTRILSIITDPNIALLLMTIGVYGLIYEFSNPGVIFPGVVGVICLLVGLFALNVLPISSAGVFLLLLGMVLMAAEAIAPTFGVLGVGGVVSFVIGAIILMDSGVPGFAVSWWTIFGTVGTMAAFLTVILAYVVRSYRKPVTTGVEDILGSFATVVDWDADTGGGEVRVTGEVWKAVPRDAKMVFKPDERVKITEVDGLKLIIEHEK